MVRTKLNRLTAMLLSFIMILSSFSALTAVEAEAAADKITVQLGDTNIKWAKTVTFYEPHSRNNYTYWQGQMRHTMRIKETGKVAYCIQPGAYLYDFVQQANPILSVGESDAWGELGDEKKSAIKLVMYFGYPNNHIYLSGTDAEKEIATQLIIWEIVCGYRDPNNYDLTDDRFAKGMFGNSYEQNQGVFTAYDKIVDSMIGYNKIISFSTPQSKNAPTYTMNWDGTKYTVTLTDKNNVIGRYTLTCSNKNVKLTVSGNQLIVSSTEPISGSVSIKARTTMSSENNNVIAYGHFNSEIQEVIDQSTSDLPDPVFAYLNVKTQATGSLKVQKQFKTADDIDLKNTIESSVLANTKFLIKNSADKYIKATYAGNGTLYHYSGYTSSASDATAFTLKSVNKSFYFDVDKLPAGTYTVIEQDNSTTGFTAKGSKNVKVTVTANNSGGIKTAQFENQPSQLVIGKTFVKYGAVTDDDYKDVTLEVTQNNAASPIKAVCIDTENNVYQYVSVSNDSVYSGKTITDQLVFYNPKVHSITIVGLPVKNSSGTYYQYTAKEKDTGRTSGRSLSKRYTYNTVTKTFQTGTTQNDTITNTEKKIGYLEIEKDFEIENTDGSRSEFTGNDSLSLTEAYSDISFLVKNSAGNYLKANFIGNQYTYTSFVNTSAEATKFSFYAGNKTNIRIINLPFGTYHVTEVMGNKVKGQGFRAESNGQKATVTFYNVSADAVVGGHTKFVNVKPQYVGLRIYKTFSDTDGESIDVSQKIYSQLSFSLSDENGTRIPVVLESGSRGTYHPFKQGNGETPRETMQIGTSTHTITITGLESGKTYLVRERIVGTDLKKICVCKSSFTVEGTRENEVVFADENAVVLGNTVTMPSGEHSTAEVYFENTYKTTEITINKESDDDLVERKFAVTTLNYSLYPAESPLYVTTEKQTVNGKVNGVAAVKDLPLAYYDEETDSIINIQYQIEEVDTPQYYEIPEKQVIIPMAECLRSHISLGEEIKLPHSFSCQDYNGTGSLPGQKSVTIRNKLKQGKIKVVKKAEVNGSDEIIPLSGVGFELTNDYNSTVLKGVTDENGEILFENLPVAVGVKGDDGKETIKKIRYTAHEVSGVRNEKYVLANDRTTTLSYTAEEAKRIRTLSFTNTPITGNVYLEKADARTKEVLSGAEFTVYNDTNGNGKYDKNDTLATGYIMSESNGQTVYTPYHTLVEVMETTEDEDGQPVAKGTGRYELYSLEKGKYIVVETKTPVGYVIEQKEFAFEIKEDGQIVHVYEKEGKPVIGDGSETVDSDEDQLVYNTPIFGDIYLHKIDESNKERLSGAVFHVWKDDGSGKLNTKKDELCGTMTELKGSDGKGTGEYEMNDLPYGTYLVTEVKAPEGYMRSKKTYTVEVRQNRQRVFIDDVENLPIKGNVSVVKIDAYTKEQLADAEFTVYADVNKDGMITKGTDTVYGKLVYNAESMTYTLSDLPYGEYVLAETKAPAGHVLTEKVYPFRIIDNGVTVEVNDDSEIGIPNDPIEGYIKVIKKDKKADIPVKGAEFTLYDSKGKVVKKVTTDKEGTADFGKLVYGKYTVKETTAPKNYVLDDTPIPFEILEHGKTYSFTQKETPKPSYGYLKKTSEDGIVEGFKFRVYGKSDSGVAYDETHTTDKNGEINVELLPGNYTVEEVKTPSRYIRPESKSIRIEVDETTKISFENKLKKGGIIIRKFDKKHPDKVVSGAVFTVYRNGKEYKKLTETSKGVYELKNVPYGDYTVKETSAPKGYLLDTGTYDFRIRNDGEIITISNSKNDNFVETMIEGSVELVKKDSKTRKPLENAEFTIYKVVGEKNEFYKALKTDKDGKLTFIELPYGDYIIEETKAPEGYNIDTGEYPFSIKENGQVFKLANTPEGDFIETQIEGTVTLIKKDSENDEPIEGAEFTLYDSDEEVFRVGYTDAQGKLTFAEVPYGEYTIKETKVPEGYLPDTESYPLNIKTHQQVITISNSTDGTFRENPIKGFIELYKVDKNTRKPLAGAEFTLFDDKGTSVQKITTDKNGKAVFSDLPFGEYNVVETKAPDEYTADSTPIPFSIVEHGKTLYHTKENTPVPGYGYLKKTSEDGVKAGFKFKVTGTSDTGVSFDDTVITNENGEFNIELLEGTYEIEEIENPVRYLIPSKQTVKIESGRTTEIKFENKLKKGNIEILKIDDTTQKPLAGAEFTLYDAKGNAVQVLMTGGDGKVTFTDVPYGKYTVVETKAPDKYTADRTPIPFEIVENGKTLYHTKKNTPVPGRGFLKKTSEDGIVEGIKFHIYGVSDTGIKYENTVITDDHGEFNLELLEGVYTVEEIELPDRYIQPDKQTVSIRSDKTTAIRFENSLKKSNISIVKKDSKNNKPIKDAEFTLYNSDGEAVITLTTDSDGKLTFADIPYGDYTVKETKAPKGYIRDKKTYPVSVRNDGETLAVSNRSDGTFREKPIEGTIEIIKLDEKTNKPLAGAEFTLYNAIGKAVQVVVTGDDGKAIFADVRYGSYTVVETKAPDKYTADPTPIPFSIVKEGLLIAYEMDNTPIPGVGYLKKTSEDGIVEGFKFHVYGSSDTGAAFDETITTDENGEFSIELLEGEYTVEEVETPDRYIQPDKQSIRIESGKTTSVEFDNRLKKGNIEIIKIDEVTRKPLAGAEFTLFDAEDNAVLVLSTGEDGKVIFENVPYGDYHVAETKAPEDYILDSTPVPFSILEDGMLIVLEKENTPDSGSLEIIKESEDGVIENVGFHIFCTAKNGVEVNETVYTDKEGKFLMENLLVGTYTVEEIEMPDRYITQEPQTVEVIANEKTVVTFENILKKGSVTTTKVDAEYPDHKLSGAVFEIFDEGHNSVGFMEEIETGIYRLDNLICGKYILKEIKAPEYYELDTNEYPFEILENGDVRNIETLAGVGFINNAQKGSLVITKRSSDNKLEGFSFRITGKAFTGQEYDEVFTTDKDGKITVEGLRVGSYTVSEISDEMNVRYILPDDKEITIPANNTAEIEMLNDEKTIPFEITKKDISTGELIPDCGFRIRNSDGEIVVEGRTDKNGIAKFELVCGDYTYQEFDAPEGYIIDTKEYTFTINPDDTIVKAEMTNIGTGTFELTKKDIATGELIPDCGIEILDENKKIIFQGRTDSDGVVTFEKLPYGKYYYREYDAPEGYVLDETPYPFEIKKNGEIVKSTMTNKPVEKEPGYITTDKPKEPGEVTVPTGDMTDFIVIMLVLTAGLSLALIVFNIRASRKKNNKN